MTNIMDHIETERPATQERRSAGRRRVLKGATLTFNRGYGAFECLVRNISQTGARLSFGETSAVPAAFSLSIKGEDGAINARVRWRSLTEIGVEFG